ncbi:hypothetical protein B296_00041442 [Ensete ventricosum]|uniref:Uncharacterized protein n=1 Tax=Ensete ventricosum TaxID=4639 RepID=A0A426ZLT7_ENSVE|nr:hypothetical protein B296_00041442 [Ensete ventricosum]
MASSEMVSSSNPEPERDAEESNLNPNPVAPPVAPVVCLMRFASDSAAGGFMGSIFGYGELYPLLCSSCLTLLLMDGFPCANTFAILSGVHSLVSCFLKRLRGKDDGMISLPSDTLSFIDLLFEELNWYTCNCALQLLMQV